MCANQFGALIRSAPKHLGTRGVLKWHIHICWRRQLAIGAANEKGGIVYWGTEAHLQRHGRGREGKEKGGAKPCKALKGKTMNLGWIRECT